MLDHSMNRLAQLLVLHRPFFVVEEANRFRKQGVASQHEVRVCSEFDPVLTSVPDVLSAA